ncbi:MAG: hypothetical protein K2L87_03775, partial [Clostridiales bacterium]|nr:hypothetical protein [Clostridiales bacterium]
AGHEVFVSAPDRNNSAVSHKLTMREPVAVKEVSPCEGVKAYAVAGSPADCVLIALCALNIKPDLVLSGINDGQNTGSDVIYSGTVAGAMEGAQNRLPSIALSQRFSMHSTPEEKTRLFLRDAKFTVDNLSAWKARAEEIEGVLNVNFPTGEITGIAICHAVRTHYNMGYRLGEEGYLMQFYPPEPMEGDGDIPKLKAGNVTLTPLKLNMTDTETLKRWSK